MLADGEPELVVKPEELADWEEVPDEEGDSYWYNARLDISTWSNPHELAAKYAAATAEEGYATGVSQVASTSHDDSRALWELRDQVQSTNSQLASTKERLKAVERENACVHGLEVQTHTPAFSAPGLKPHHRPSRLLVAQ